ncbi:uncharacterized protein KY384_000870 [Bacidia gigantensis]|uniref:uncharacterized protein n=1 Tax=Bacidia gigantensis TaxID=2732470 RepID=UPI001D05A323|nr:uncharacterized protein KY384_000870 [Bacidia gigantensis]KAG8534027.1 hypothetical protein KY384_000870 [Bacidia gigantensis]
MASQSPRHIRKDSITSPGLDALAAAASNADPIVSPPNSSGFATNYHPSIRRQSGGAQSYESFQPTSQFSPTLVQYGHVPSGEYRPPSSGDPRQSLPPYQPSGFVQPSQLPQQDALNNTTLFQTQEGVNRRSPSLPHEGEIKFSDQHDGALTAQIREPLPGPEHSLPEIAVPETQSEQVEVKTEMGDVPMQEAQMPNNPELLQSDMTMDGFEQNKIEPTPLPEKPETPVKASPKPKAPPKKRAPPKKGTASAVKNPAKKRKLDNSTESVEGSPSRGTPGTNRASLTPAPKNKKQASDTPTRSSSIAADDDDYDGGSDNEVFCICRKPDDHGVMIGCDGPCEDWFHLKCVDMTEAKTKLIQKWYCPNCSASGHDTLWRRMCRLPGCSEPARTDEKGKNLSKYCSDEHGEDFMRRLVEGKGSEPAPTIERATRRKSQHQQLTPDKGPEAYEDPRGGVLKPADLKAITDYTKDVTSFHALGEASVPSPPRTASPNLLNGNSTPTLSKPDPPSHTHTKITYTPSEQSTLSALAQKKSHLLSRREMLTDRDKFVALVSARHKTILAKLKETDKSLKDICGYDSRLTWSDHEFDAWRTSADGVQALESGVLGEPPRGKLHAMPNGTAVVKVNGVLPPPVLTNGTTPKAEGDGDGDEEMPDAEDGKHSTTNAEIEEGVEEIGKGVCKKKRCERHRAWNKNQMNDNLFEKNQVRVALKKVEGEEKGVRDCAVLRGLEDDVGAAAGGREGDGVADGDGEV